MLDTGCLMLDDRGGVRVAGIRWPIGTWEYEWVERSAAGGRDSVPTVVRRSKAPEHVNQPEPTAAQAVDGGRILACKFVIWW
jgi:hypothetical protein